MKLLLRISITTLSLLLYNKQISCSSIYIRLTRQIEEIKETLRCFRNDFPDFEGAKNIVELSKKVENNAKKRNTLARVRKHIFGQQLSNELMIIYEKICFPKSFERVYRHLYKLARSYDQRFASIETEDDIFDLLIKEKRLNKYKYEEILKISMENCVDNEVLELLSEFIRKGIPEQLKLPIFKMYLDARNLGQGVSYEDFAIVLAKAQQISKIWICLNTKVKISFSRFHKKRKQHWKLLISDKDINFLETLESGILQHKDDRKMLEDIKIICNLEDSVLNAFNILTKDSKFKYSFTKFRENIPSKKCCNDIKELKLIDGQLSNEDITVIEKFHQEILKFAGKDLFDKLIGKLPISNEADVANKKNLACYFTEINNIQAGRKALSYDLLTSHCDEERYTLLMHNENKLLKLFKKILCLKYELYFSVMSTFLQFNGEIRKLVHSSVDSSVKGYPGLAKKLKATQLG